MAGLKDMNQLITYQYEADSMDRQWYSILWQYNLGRKYRRCAVKMMAHFLYI